MTPWHKFVIGKGMDFGKLPDLKQLDRLRLELPPIEKRIHYEVIPNAKPKVYVGPPIWGKKDWVGKVYPVGTQSKDFLKYYSQQFNTIELNSTFYQIPSFSTVENWRKTVPESFKFCPKVFQGISRFEALKDIPALTQGFCEAVLQFEQNLGVSFLQLPPSFEPRQLLILKRFFTLLPKDFRLAIEFRHPGWFKDNQLIDPAFELLADNGIGTVITDVAGRRDVLHGSLTTQSAMIRFVGNSLHPSDWTRLESWIQRLGEWFALGINEVTFFVHQPLEEGTLALIDRFVVEMNRRYGLELQSWDPALGNPQTELFG